MSTDVEKGPRNNARADGDSPLMANVIPATPKAIEAKQKLDYELHVALIMRTERLSKSRAVFRAYTEGPSGLDKRLLPASPAN